MNNKYFQQEIFIRNGEIIIFLLFYATGALPVIMSTSSILSLAIPICLVVVALGAALAYFVIRHRRLSNSFTQFANSHYDTRRGQATFPGTTDGLGESTLQVKLKKEKEIFMK